MTRSDDAALEATIRTLAEFAPVAISIQTTERFLYVNPEWEKTTGYSRAEAEQLSPLEIVAPEMRDLVLQRAQARLRGEDVVNRYEVKGQRKSGEPFWFDMTAKAMAHGGEPAVLTIAVDTTEHRRTRLALAESERRLRTLMDNLPGMAYRCRNAPGWPMQIVSEGVRQLTGYAPDEISGEGTVEYGDLVHPDDREMVWREVQKAVESGGPFELEYRLLRRDGQERWVWERGRAVPVADRATPVLEGFISDITARRESEQALRDVEAQLRHSQKLEAIGQLAGGIAHDFNNILQAVSGYSELLASQLAEDDGRRALTVEIRRGIERATTLTRQLLAFGRRQVLQLRPVAVDDVVHSLAGMLDRLIGDHIELRCSQPEEPVVVTADRGQLEQVLVNLCVNARDAMPGGGRLMVSVERCVLDDAFCAGNTWARTGEFACIRVTDAGCGIPEEIQDKVFEPFFTTKPTGQGTGLGLSTVYGIVQQHEGLIQILSEVGKGTTIEVYLPTDERDVRYPARASDFPAPGGTELVLLAEDDAQVRAVAKEILCRFGYQVLAASDGEEALQLYAANADTIDIAVLDVVMPRLDGPAVADRLRAQRFDLPVVFASGYPAGGLRTDFMVTDGVQLLEKPYAARQLLHAVRAALDGESRV